MDLESFRRYTTMIHDSTLGDNALLDKWELVPFTDALHHPDIIAMVEHMNCLGNPSLRGFSSDCWRVAHDPDWESLLDSFRDLHVRRMQVTMYGMSNTHDWFAGKRGSFEATGHAVDRLVAKGFQITWGIILHERNATEIDELMQWIREKTPDVPIVINTFTFDGHGAKNMGLAISQESFVRLSPSAKECIHEDLHTEPEWRELVLENQFPEQRTWDKLSRTVVLIISRDGTVSSGTDGCFPLGHMDGDSMRILVAEHDKTVLPYYEKEKTREKELLERVAGGAQEHSEDKLLTSHNQLLIWKMREEAER